MGSYFSIFWISFEYLSFILRFILTFEIRNCEIELFIFWKLKEDEYT